MQAAKEPGAQLGVQAGQVLSPLAEQQGWRLVGKREVGGGAESRALCERLEADGAWAKGESASKGAAGL